ncbi:MAG: agmatine deiminase [Firmicutes bacterium]|nr:agmatine deiminase [Bacillota bacterium]
MSKEIKGSTPKSDGFRMPAEFEPQDEIFMIWPYRTDNWRNAAEPAQKQFADVAKAISKFENVTMLAAHDQYENCRAQLPADIRVIETSSDDAWCRDSGPTFLIDGKGGRRAVNWTFNAWGGLVDGLYFPWNDDELIAQKICEITRTDYYRTEGFVLEGGSFHVDGEGTVLTTEMCLLSKGRNPDMSKQEIEHMLCEYLNCEKVLWLKDGIDPNETNGHIDDVACFIRPGEVCCIYTEDKSHPFYEASQDALKRLSCMTDAKGRQLKVHKLCCTKNPIFMEGAETIDHVCGSKIRQNGDLCIASYANFLICNNAVIVPQYDDENDELALSQIRDMFPDRNVVGVHTREIVYGGGNIHCITQQVPLNQVPLKRI